MAGRTQRLLSPEEQLQARAIGGKAQTAGIPFNRGKSSVKSTNAGIGYFTTPVARVGGDISMSAATVSFFKTLAFTILLSGVIGLFSLGVEHNLTQFAPLFWARHGFFVATTVTFATTFVSLLIGAIGQCYDNLFFFIGDFVSGKMYLHTAIAGIIGTFGGYALAYGLMAAINGPSDLTSGLGALGNSNLDLVTLQRSVVVPLLVIVSAYYLAFFYGSRWTDPVGLHAKTSKKSLFVRNDVWQAALVAAVIAGFTTAFTFFLGSATNNALEINIWAYVIRGWLHASDGFPNSGLAILVILLAPVLGILGNLAMHLVYRDRPLELTNKDGDTTYSVWGMGAPTPETTVDMSGTE